ncbi:MAG: hypothetical protein MUF23_03055 [Pirellula sp.]|nr:hypothetical protein [Pirellula sp.]
MLSLRQTISFILLSCILPSPILLANVVLKIGDVTVLRQDLPQLVLVPFTAISDTDIKVSGFNFNIDIGEDGQVLPTGVSLPVDHLPDTERIIAQGGEANARNWNVVTEDARIAFLSLSDIFVIGNGGVGQDIPILGNTGNQTGGATLFYLALNLDTTVSDRIDITMPNESDDLPFLSGSASEALKVTYLSGSITISNVPEPSSAWLLACVAIAVCRRRHLGLQKNP